MKTNTSFFVSLAAVLAIARPALAEDEPKISVEQGESSVTVRVDNLQVPDTTLATKGDRVFIDVPDGTPLQKFVLSNDRTVKRVEISYRGGLKLNVHLHHGKKKTEAIGSRATVENIKGGILLHIPRWPIADSFGANPPAIAAQESTNEDTEPEKVTEPIAKPVAEQKHDEAVIEESAPTPSVADTKDPSAKEEETSEDDADPVIGTTQPTSNTEIGAGSDGGGGGVSYGLLAGFFLLAAGGGVFAWRTKKKANGTDEPGLLRIVASKQIGPKSRIVWLKVGAREILVAVGDNGTSFLSEWGDAEPVAMKDASIHAQNGPPPPPVGVTSQSASGSMPPVPKTNAPSSRYAFQANLDAATKSVVDSDVSKTTSGTSVRSPAIAGLLRLRGEAPTINVEVASEDHDADAEWARELLKATRDTVRRRMD